jgi:hypothetical protein
MSNKRNDQDANKKPEAPADAVTRLRDEIIEESKLIATGCTESCYTLVEKTKQLIDAENKAK